MNTYDTAFSDLYYFSRFIFHETRGYKWQKSDHHAAICRALLDVYNGKTKRLIINCPPRYSKTELAVINFVAWTLGRHPDCEFIHASYSARLAAKNSWHVRDMVQHPEYRKIFPMVELRDDSKAKDEWRTTQGGCMYAVGAGGSITGYGAGKVRQGFGGCFPYHQLIKTEYGNMSIGDIVTKQIDVRVWSYNQTTKQTELKAIKTFWTNPANEIISVHLSNCTAFECTPNHRILTSRGWIDAIELSQSFNLINCQSSFNSNLLSCFGAVNRYANNVTRMLRFIIPIGINKVFSYASPRFPSLNLSNNTNANAVNFSQFFARLFTGKNINSILSSELCTWYFLKQWKCTVPNSILHIFRLCTPCKINKPVVGANAVKMPTLHSLFSRFIKTFKNKVVDIAHCNIAIDRQINAVIPLAVTVWFKLFSVSPYPAKIRNLIKPFCFLNVTPLFINKIGHADTTYCLEIEKNNNFILSHSGAIASNCIIVDDPHKADEATSDVMRQNVIDWFQNTLESRRNSPETPIILIMQRLHENDLSGFLLGGGNGEQWEHLCLSAIKDDGTALWHDKHTIDDLNRMEEASPYVFAGQYRQMPAPPDGGTFKPERIPVISELPADTRFIRAWDLASTAGGGDWTVGAKIGLLKSGRWVIVDIVRLQGSPDQVETAIINTASLDGHSCVIQIPQDPAQAGKSQVAYLSRLLASYNVKAVRPTGSKETRAAGFAAQCNVGNVDMLKAHWNQTLINEMIMFPFGKHDDQIDACSDGFMHFSNNRPILTPIFRGI